MSRGDRHNGFGEWGGYMEAKITKLEEQFSDVSELFRESSLFSGISIFVNGLTNPSSDELKRMMMVHGGTYHHYQRSHTTYIIASNLPDVKVRQMDTSKIITAQWVVDCIKENKILDYTKYLLYTNHKPSQPKLFFSKAPKASPMKVEERKIEKPAGPELKNIFKDLEELNKQISIAKNSSKIDDKKPGSTEMEVDLPKMNTNSPDLFEDIEMDVKTQERDVEKKAPPKSNVAKTAVDPNFLSEFYNNSRLHHISSLGTGFKQYVCDLREKHSGQFPARQTLRSKLPQSPDFQPYDNVMMHIDMDCFFVSVGLRNRPHLKGQPVAVTHSRGGRESAPRVGVNRQKEMELYLKRFDGNTAHSEIEVYVPSDRIKHAVDTSDSLSEIASCSYEARRTGIRNGMFVGQALKLCPQLKTIPYDFDGYREVAYALYDTVAQYTLNIEAVSCDEMVVNLTDVLNDLKADVMDFVQLLRDEIKEKTQCTCSAGIGGNRLQARMATKKAKPNGQFYLLAHMVKEYMEKISIADLPGVGYTTNKTLEEYGWRTCGDLQTISMGEIQKIVGKKFGETLYNFCRGIDNRALVYGQIRKSVSAEVNYGIRFTEIHELEKFLRQLCNEVHSRLMEIKRQGKCITLKLMVRAKEAPVESSKFMGHGYCDHLTKSVSLSNFTSDVEVIWKNVWSTMKSMNIPTHELRGIGIQISRLNLPNQGNVKQGPSLLSMFSKVAEKKKENNPQKPNQQTEVICEPSTSRKEVHEDQSNGDLRSEQKPPHFQHDQNAIQKKPNNVLSMFQNAASARATKKSQPSMNYDEIDYSVLAELPEDIRKEALEDYQKIIQAEQMKQKRPATAAAPKTSGGRKTAKRKKLKSVENAKSKSNNNKVTAPIGNNERSATAKPSIAESSVGGSRVQASSSDSAGARKDPIISSDNIINQSNWRNLIESWVNSCESPEECDSEILANHMQEFIRAQRINDLYVPLRFFHRIISEKGNCAWHRAYLAVFNIVQAEMINVYGSKMLLSSRIDCDNCCIF